MSEPKPIQLTVIIRNPSNFIHMQEPNTFRSVRIVLTEDQARKLELRQCGCIGMKPYYEEISQCFLENATVEKGIT